MDNEERKKKMKEYRERNKEYFKEYRNEYRKKHRERILEDLRKRSKEHYKKNKEYYRKKHKEYNRLNKEKIIKHRKEVYEKNKKDFLNTFKKGRVCERCGYSDHYEILQFHHRDRTSKKLTIGNLEPYQKNSSEIMKEEVKKCILLCPNCHFIQHFKERRDKTK